MHFDVYTVYTVIIIANLLILVLCGLGIYRGLRDHDRYSAICYGLLVIGVLIAVKLTLQAAGYLGS